MGYGQRLKIQRSADVRVLKSQLDLIAAVVHSSRLISPAWAMIVSLVGSDLFGYFGHRSVYITGLGAALITGVMFAGDRVVATYEQDTATNPTADRLQAWFGKFAVLQIAISAAWGILPWVVWDPANQLNHVLLAATVVCVFSGFVVTRASHMDMFIATLIPIVALTSMRLLFGGSWLDIALAVMMPIYAFQLFFDGRRMTYRMDEDSRLRFEVEDLARELEDARDEALRKRFEAETANASKTAFLANMSHELRTPLNAILGFSEIIAKECFGAVGSPRYKEYAGDIHASGSHLLSLINDLLDVAKIEAGRMEIEPEPLDARKIFDTTLKIIGAKARERNQQLVIEVDPSTPQLWADERALKQILINLVSNAVKFTPEGGRIDVVAGRARGGGFQIMVQDNGPGIPRDKLDRIFKPFSQVDNRYDRQGGGTGLGLALVRGLAELHGGRAWIESEHGHGCRAYVVLPVPVSGAAAAGDREPVAA
ncbi:MAG TPA: HAMP domain-containing sensor histidine kinase [Rhizomicrobium sp.]|nr:HAMP domain-containing sensor histidine kinase [Rhizomicrobium sp.]